MTTQQGTMKQTKEEIISAVLKEQKIVNYTGYFKSAMSAAMDIYAQQSGIHWFSIANGELPPVGEEVFVFAEIGEFKCLAKGYIEASKIWRHNGGDWTPTHFAFINYPE